MSIRLIVRDLMSAIAFALCMTLALDPSRDGALRGMLLGSALFALDLRYVKRGAA